MKIEIEVPEQAIKEALILAAKSLISSDPWSPGKLLGEMASSLKNEMREQVRAQIEAIDLTTEIKAIVAERAIPALRDAIKKELAAEAKRAVKSALDEKTQ